MNDVVARVFRTQALEWWAEVWTPRVVTDPPSPLKPFPPPDGWPEPVAGHVRRGLALRHSRRAARRAAREMADRLDAGLPAEPTSRPVPEIVR